MSPRRRAAIDETPGITRDRVNGFERAEIPPTPPGPQATEGRMLLDANDRDLARISGLAWQAVQAANQPPWLFAFGGGPVRLEHDDEGVPRCRALTVDRVRHHLARVATWTRTRRDGTLIDALPPVHVCADLLASPTPPLPRLTRLTEAPVFTADGRLLSTSGYDPASGILYAPAEGFALPAAVDPCPSPEMVEAARTLVVTELFGDFPFTGQAERAHAVALALLPFVRDLIDGPTPLHLVEKPTPRTGATLLVTAALYPALGRPAMTLGVPKDDTEMGKRLTAALRAGRPAVFFDNVPQRDTLDSAELSRAITSLRWGDRVLGLSEDVNLPVRAVFVATGNNPRLSKELAGRTVRCRLDAHQEHPGDRNGFRHPSLLDWARATRADLVWALCTLTQAWLAAGRPPGPHTLGGFESWARTLGGILDTAGILGFLANAIDFRLAVDTEGRAIRQFLTRWWLDPDTHRTTVAELYVKLVKPGPCDLDLTSKSEQGERIRLGKLLLTLQDQYFTLEIDDHTTVRVIVRRDDKVISGTTQWRLDQVPDGE